MNLKNRMTTSLIVSLLLVTCYVACYVCLSTQGRFEPSLVGLNGVKRYEWAPDGFVNEFKWSRPKLIFYYPLHVIDMRYFHLSEDAYSGRFPINEVSEDEIGTVYQAWGLMNARPSSPQ
jgi:hypothetical protein